MHSLCQQTHLNIFVAACPTPVYAVALVPELATAWTCSSNIGKMQNGGSGTQGAAGAETPAGERGRSSSRERGEILSIGTILLLPSSLPSSSLCDPHPPYHHTLFCDICCRRDAIWLEPAGYLGTRGTHWGCCRTNQDCLHVTQFDIENCHSADNAAGTVIPTSRDAPETAA